MEGKRLLERIREMDRGKRGQAEAEDADALQNSILNHLSKLLNVRQGSAVIGDEFGIPDFSDLTASFGSEAIGRIEKSLYEVIGRYEPRLKNIKLQFAPDADDPLNVVFRLEGELVGVRTDKPVVFDTVLTPNGRITITRS